MVKLVYTHASGACGGNSVRVRVSLAAQDSISFVRISNKKLKTFNIE